MDLQAKLDNYSILVLGLNFLGTFLFSNIAGHGMMSERVVERQRTCFYPHEQCCIAFDQWTRMMDSMLLAKSKTSDSTRGSSSVPRRQPVDPGLARLVQAEAANWNGKESTQANNAEGCALDGDALPSSEVGGRRSVVSPSGTSRDSVKGKEFEDVSPSCRRGLTPWKDATKCYSPGLQGLHEEIDDFYIYMRPLPEEQYMRQNIITRLTHIVLELWPAAEVKVFGSFKTDLYLPTSDIDLVVMCDDVDSQTALKMLEQKLIEKNAYDDVKVIKTSVPIVKFTDRRTAVKVDVSFNVQTGISSADFIKSMMDEYSELPYLVLILKQFLLYRNLLESFNGGISSYCLILLIISYLQLHPEDRKTGNHGDMLIKFLELYGRHFNYLRTGIRICNGGSYFRKNENEGELGNRFSLLCIEDPFNPANDVGQGCYGAMKVREEFDKAYRELCDAVLPQYQHIQPVGSSFLGRILLLPPEVIQYRHLIKEKYRDYVANHFVASFPFESLSTGIDDNRSDDAGSTCSQNSNLSSEQQMTKSSTGSSSSSNSTSPGSSIPSETESDVQSEGTKHVAQSSNLRHTASVESSSGSYLIDSDLYYLQQANPTVSIPSSPYSQQLPPPMPPSAIIVDQVTPSVPISHANHHTSGRSNSWHNTTRSQGIKSSQRSAATSTAVPPTASTNIGNPTGSKTFVPTGRYNSERRRKQNGRYESTNSGGGAGFMSNR